jgi:CHAT domain-containing protein
MDLTSNPIYRIALQVQQGKLSLADAEAQVIAGRPDRSTVDQSDDDVQTLRERDVELAIILARLNQAAAKIMSDKRLKGYCAFTLGQIYKRQGKDAAALACFEDAKIYLESDQDILAQIRLNAAEIKERQNDLETALYEFAQLIGIAKQLKDTELETDACLGLGRVRLAQERAERAKRAFKRALAISSRDKDQRGMETALGNLGQVHHYLGNLQEAKKSYAQAIDISRGIGHLAGTGRHLNHLGNVWLDLGDLTKAEECYQEALRLARQTGEQLTEQKCVQNQGNLWCDKARRTKAPGQRAANLDRAQHDYQQAWALARSRQDRRGEADLLLSLGNVYSDLKELTKAQQYYTDALVLAKGQHLFDSEWRIYYAWGKVCDALDQIQQAHDYYQAAIDIVEQQRQVLRIESRTKFWQERSLLYKRMTLCCLRRKDLWAALEYTERAKTRYLAELLSQDTVTDNTTQDTVRAIVNDLPTSTAIVVFNLTEAGTVIFIVTRQPDQAVATLRKEDWKLWIEEGICIRAKLIEGFKRNRLQQLLVEVDDTGRQIGGYLFDYHKNFTRWINATFTRVCTEIGTELLVPLCQQLELLSTKRIVLMPNLGLSLLPLHACTVADGNKQAYLLDRYETTYAPSFDVLQHCQGLARQKSSDEVSLFAVSNPTGDLRCAEFEVAHISRLLPARTLDGSEENQATQVAVMSEARNHALIHFAGHGHFDLNDPLHSFLRLATPPPLTAESIFKELELPRARLVVMSACETGMVDAADLADEYLGLPASFVHAGAPNVVSSLWAVTDQSTALLMNRFYKYHLRGDPTRKQGPMRPSRALSEAQHWLRSKPKFAHPYYWAGFTVMGAI